MGERVLGVRERETYTSIKLNARYSDDKNSEKNGNKARERKRGEDKTARKGNGTFDQVQRALI